MLKWTSEGLIGNGKAVATSLSIPMTEPVEVRMVIYSHKGANCFIICAWADTKSYVSRSQRLILYFEVVVFMSQEPRAST